MTAAGGQNIPSRMAWSRGNSSGASADAAASRPTSATMSSKWMMLLNETFRLQDEAPSEIVSCIHPNQPWDLYKPAS